MKRLIKSIMYIGGLVLPLIFLNVISAQEVPIKIQLVADKTAYQPGEPIQIWINVYNNINQEVITRKGFMDQKFHLMITFTAPDGTIVNSKYPPSGGEPGPAYRFEDKDAALVEIIPAGWTKQPPIVIADTKAYYDLTKYVRWTAQVTAAFESFSEYIVDSATGESVAYLDSRVISGVAAESNKISFEILSPTPTVTSAIRVTVNLLRIGQGAKPPTTKKPLEGVRVHLIPLSRVPQDYYPINFKTYGLIYKYVKPDPNRDVMTNAKGIAYFENVPKDDYIVIGQYNGSSDFKHMGSPVDASDPGWGNSQIIQKHLMVMEKSNGKQVPGKTTKKTGSELLIIEPEFVLWDSTQELYPFVFETIGDWSVSTSVDPPEGFKADYKSLPADVRNEIEAVQFTITDVGSKWEETEVTYKIKHGKKQETIKSKIGIKLSKKLAKEKGLGIYGHTESPGDFEGGRKVGKKKE